MSQPLSAKGSDRDGDGDGREIEIEGINKAIAFLEENDIFNLPKDIGEVEIEVETGKQGLNKLLQNQQFNEILAKAGLPTGEQLKRKLKGDEVEIEKEIKLPDGSTLEIELEAEEGEVEFSLGIEREDEGEGHRNGTGIGLQQIAGNVLSFLADANPGNLASVLANQVGINPGAIEDIGDLISGETSVSEIISDLGGGQIRKLADYALNPLREAFGVVPDQVISFLGDQVGLDTEQISQVTDVLSGQSGIDDLIGSDASDLLFGDNSGLDNLLGFNPISIVGSGLFDAETRQNILNTVVGAGKNIGEAVKKYVDSLDPKQSIQFYYQSSAVLDVLFRDAKDGKLYGDSVGIDLTALENFVNAYSEVHEYMLKLYEFATRTNFSQKPDPQLWKDWQRAVNALKGRYKDIVDTDPYTFGETLVSAYLGELQSQYVVGAEPDTIGQWQDFFGNYYKAIRGLKTDLLPKSEQEKKADLERLSLVLDIIPVVGQIKGVAELVVQRNLITGERYTAADNVLGVLGAVFDVADFVKFGKSVILKKSSGAFEVVTDAADNNLDNIAVRAAGGEEDLVSLKVTSSEGNEIPIGVPESEADAVKDKLSELEGVKVSEGGSGGNPPDGGDPPTGGSPDPGDINWTPSMTREQAETYVKGSYYEEEILYHGTNVEGAKNIAESGVDPAFFNPESNYGPGFYLAKDGEAAREYAELTAGETGQGQVLLGIKIKAENPKIFTDGTAYLLAAEDYVRRANINTFEPAVEYTKYLRSQGYDAVEIQSLGYVVVFEPEQVVVIQRETF